MSDRVEILRRAREKDRAWRCGRCGQRIPVDGHFCPGGGRRGRYSTVELLPSTSKTGVVSDYAAGVDLAIARWLRG